MLKQFFFTAGSWPNNKFQNHICDKNMYLNLRRKLNVTTLGNHSIVQLTHHQDDC